jgi:hypothetical protein
LLEFEHIVQVNDPGNSELPVITRSQLWQGLVYRARNPQCFNHSLTCEIDERDASRFTRRIKTGPSQFVEEVVLTPEQQIVTQSVPAEPLQTQSITSIEEPECHSLFVRFHYRRDLIDNDPRVDVAAHLKAAYVQIDRDAISEIRRLAANLPPDSTLNTSFDTSFDSSLKTRY